jgi:hypothetical protein
MFPYKKIKKKLFLKFRNEHYRNLQSEESPRSQPTKEESPSAV